MNAPRSIISKAALRCLFSSDRRWGRTLFACCLFASIAAQPAWSQGTREPSDTIVPLGDIVVKGFGSGRSRNAVPASVSLLRTRDISRFSNTSLVPVMNTLPGVRMEERSPGSYRLSMRGSLIRSPFGIRNVKVYLDDIILTDAGGNTYLNLIDMNLLSGIEVIRGPAGSIYGSGTGGVVHLSAAGPAQASTGGRADQTGRLQVSAGSYGQYAQNLGWVVSGKRSRLAIAQGVYLSDGYRKNSRMRRDAFQADWTAEGEKGAAYRGFLLLSDLSYRTPGGLTLAQQSADPRQARPATPVLPSAEAQRTGIDNATALAGFSASHRLSGGLHWRNALTYSRTGFSNPFFSNYERRRETNLGLRSVLDLRREWSSGGLGWVTGIEWQQGDYAIDSSGNQGGLPDARLVRDQVKALQGFLFTQLEVRLPGNLTVQTGISLNRFSYRLARTLGTPSLPPSDIGFDLQPAPRLAVLWKPVRTLSLHASLTRGFSPPSLAEVKPSAGGFGTGLQAENGWSREAGVKGALWRNRIQFDATVFDFLLREAIVRRTNASGAEFFINAGDIRQRGVEAFLEAFPIQHPASAAVRQLRLWTSLTLSDFRFGTYTSGNTSTTGNRLTGVPDATATAGADLSLAGGAYANLTRYQCGRLPLTDANDAFAEPYVLWHARIGWRSRPDKKPIDIFLAAENLNDVLYSSGNDLNAFGRRYFNPAPGRSFVLGVNMGF